VNQQTASGGNLPPSNSPTADRFASHWTYLAIMLLSLLIRGGFATARPNGLKTDPDGYRQIAMQLREHGSYQRRDAVTNETFPTAYRPPLYPLVLSIVSPAPQAILLLHVLLASVTAICIYRIGALLQLGKLVWVAIIGMLLDPILLNQSALPMTETIAAALSVAVWLAFIRWWQQRNWRNALLLGVALGLAVLCRPTFAIWSVILLAAAVKTNRSGLATAIAFALVLCPWAIRNQQVFGKPIFLTTHGGYTFLLGNNDEFYNHFYMKGGPSVWNAKKFHQQWKDKLATIEPSDELGRDKLAYETAAVVIARRPEGFRLSCTGKLLRFWRLAPTRRTESEGTRTTLMRYAIGFWYAVILGAAACTLIWKRRELQWEIWLPAILLCLTFSVIHTFYWSDMRMRGPIMPSIYLLIAFGLYKLQCKDRSPASDS
jgi:4-amino-4-deoxy-L-arabinose transferase-like glycosyltransferase